MKTCAHHTCTPGLIGSAYGCPGCGLGPQTIWDRCEALERTVPVATPEQQHADLLTVIENAEARAERLVLAVAYRMQSAWQPEFKTAVKVAFYAMENGEVE